MTLLAGGINRLFDVLLWPVASLPALAMVAVSLLTAVMALLIFKYTTHQNRLSQAKDKLIGHIYEMGLYQDHLSVLARIQGRLAVANLRYLSLTLPAVLALLVPMVVIFVQLESRFEHRNLQAGEETLFSVQLSEDHAARINDLELITPPGISIISGPVRNRPSATAVWGLRVDHAQPGDLVIHLDGEPIASRTVLSEDRLPRLNESSGTGFFDPIFFPGAPALNRSGLLTDMTLRLPDRDTSYLGISLNWLLAFCLFSLLGGFLLKDALGVSL